MIYITEAQSASVVTLEMAYDAVRAAFCASAASKATIFPVVLGHASDPQNRFTIKSATDLELAGLKIGSYFPTNDERSLPRHDSIILLFDQAKGRIGAIVEGGKLNAFRTAAADAVACDALARPNSAVLALFGTGHQAIYEAIALARIRPLTRILVVGRDPARAAALSELLRHNGLVANPCDAEAACAAADIIVTVTTSTSPLFQADWVKPGTHISSMGSDSVGKQELHPDLFNRAKLFCDLPEQSRRIGEFQHAGPEHPLTGIGEVLTCTATGRTDTGDITIFDSSGLSLQDLYVARAVIDAVRGRETE